MFKTKSARHSINQVASALLTTAITLGICLTPTTALAANSPVAIPTTVAVGKTNLYITLSGVGYEAFTSSAPSGCTTVSADTFKLWVSLTQSALLAGKTVFFRYTDCGGVHSIDTVDINQ